MRVGLLYSRVRVEERLLIEELERRGVEHELIDVRSLVFDIHDGAVLPSGRHVDEFDVFFERCISQTSALTVVRMLESRGLVCVNTSDVIDVCGDKLRTSLELARRGVPTPRVKAAVEPESAMEAIEAMGYPVVLKPTVGSWGRLLARVNDRDAAEAVVEHKSTLGSVSHSVFYVQEHIDKPGRDIRVFMVGGESIAAIARESEHWITNTARGGKASRYEVSSEVAEVCRGASEAMGGGILAVDLLETRDGRILVSEVNHTMEFRNSIEPTGVDIPGRMLDFVLSRGTPTGGPVGGTREVTR